MDNREFSKYTEQIRSRLPFWFSIKKNHKESFGMSFLNIFGLGLDEIERLLDYAYKQTKIETADINYADILYKINLPTYFNIETIISIQSSNDLLEETDSLFELFNLEKNLSMDDNIKQPDYYFIDKENKIIYVTDSYDKTPNEVFGRLSILVNDSNGNKYITFPLELHNVWNFFDEFGALLNCPRLYGEGNLSYKYRIKDVFINPANSTRYGLVNGLARELNLRKHIVWEDTSKDLIIKDRMVIVNTIQINSNYISVDKIIETNEGFLVIKADKSIMDKSEVSFVHNINLFSIIRHNTEVDNLLFKANGDLNVDFLRYIKEIKGKSSIFFKDFKYNDGIFIDKEIDKDSFLFEPNRLDAKIKGFAKYSLCGGKYEH